VERPNAARLPAPSASGHDPRPNAGPPSRVELTLDGTHTVLTPEYVEFNFVLAGMMSRFLAWLLDTMISMSLAAMLLVGLAVADLVLQGLGSAAAFVVWFFIDWGYMIVLEIAWNGQTIGKKALGLRVLQESGVRVGFHQSLLRNLARPVDRLPLFYLVGGVAALLSRSQQRLGDVLAGTIVVRERRLKIPSAIERPEGDTTLLADPEFQRRVSRLSDEEEATLLSAAIRREELGMEARLTLFAALARRLEEEIDLTRPPHLSDEKLVLLVTAALAARRARQQRPQK
jgi:uncharacterized RDD family membrane protein YckC